MREKTKTDNKTRSVKRRRFRVIFASILVLAGLTLIVIAAVLEAAHYPWGILFGTTSQNADAIPDPSPIALDEEDSGAMVTLEPSEFMADASLSPSGESTVTDNSAATPSAESTLPGDETVTAKSPASSKYVILGSFKIPVLNVSQNLLEGSGKQMKYGVGHVTSTALPGQKGNCAIAGHRPYPFRYLDKLKVGDSIVIKAGGITYKYTVYDSFDVLPNEVWVLNNIKGESYTLTLITCTPYLVSSHRLIIRARLTDINGMTPQAYYGIEETESTPADAPAETQPSVSDASVSAALPTTDSNVESDGSVTASSSVSAAS